MVTTQGALARPTWWLIKASAKRWAAPCPPYPFSRLVEKADERRKTLDHADHRLRPLMPCIFCPDLTHAHSACVVLSLKHNLPAERSAPSSQPT